MNWRFVTNSEMNVLLLEFVDGKFVGLLDSNMKEAFHRMVLDLLGLSEVIKLIGVFKKKMLLQIKLVLCAGFRLVRETLVRLGFDILLFLFRVLHHAIKQEPKL